MLSIQAKSLYEPTSIAAAPARKPSRRINHQGGTSTKGKSKKNASSGSVLCEPGNYKEKHFAAIEESAHLYLRRYMNATLKPEYWPANAMKTQPTVKFMLEYHEAFFQAFWAGKAIGFRAKHQPDPQSALLALSFAALARAYANAQGNGSYPNPALNDLAILKRHYRRKGDSC